MVEIKSILMKLFLYSVIVRSEICVTITDGGNNHVSLLQYGNFLKDKQLLFKVKTSNDAHVKLYFPSSNYTIIIGGWGNTRSVIVTQNQKANEITINHYETNIVTDNAYRKFWMSWKNGLIKFGKGNVLDKDTLMEIQDQCLYALQDIEILTQWGSTVTWLIQQPSAEVYQNKKLQMTMFQENRNCTSLQEVNTLETPSAINCGLQCMITRECKGFEVDKSTEKCKLYSEEAGNSTLPSTFIMKD